MPLFSDLTLDLGEELGHEDAHTPVLGIRDLQEGDVMNLAILPLDLVADLPDL
jgi:hypothetical protein